MGEIGEESVAEGIVAEVLNGTAAVGVGVSLLKLRFGEIGIVLEEDGADGLFPGEVDQFFVGLNRVGDRFSTGEEEDTKDGDTTERSPRACLDAVGRSDGLLEHF